jgi:hypothetical protein
MREALRRRALLNQLVPLDVVPAELGLRAELIGAIVLALQATDVFDVGEDGQDSTSGLNAQTQEGAR